MGLNELIKPIIVIAMMIATEIKYYRDYDKDDRILGYLSAFCVAILFERKYYHRFIQAQSLFVRIAVVFFLIFHKI
jgi:hypothetical protein